MVEKPRAHEETDISIRAIAGMGAGLLGIVALIAAGTTLATRWAASRTDPNAPKASPLYRPTHPPEPRLQVVPAEEMRAYRDREERNLRSYGWVDKANGVVRIPIDVAKKKLLETGLPVESTSPSPGGP